MPIPELVLDQHQLLACEHFINHLLDESRLSGA